VNSETASMAKHKLVGQRRGSKLKGKKRTSSAEQRAEKNPRALRSKNRIYTPTERSDNEKDFEVPMDYGEEPESTVPSKPARKSRGKGTKGSQGKWGRNGEKTIPWFQRIPNQKVWLKEANVGQEKNFWSRPESKEKSQSQRCRSSLRKGKQEGQRK
jgi:hypothetical protein